MRTIKRALGKKPQFKRENKNEIKVQNADETA